MLKSSNYYQEIERRIIELRSVEVKLEKALNNYPPGKISVKQRGNSTQYYYREHSYEKTGIYIKKKETARIKRYLQKDYDERVLKAVRKELKTLESFLEKHNMESNQIREIYASYLDEPKQFISPIDCLDSDYIKYWENLPKFTTHPMEIPQSFQTERGEYVRSKSELNIANALYRMGVPYKYEYPLVLQNGKVIFPDITALNVRQRREWYWEHRGMMDNHGYAEESVDRVRDYEKNGIYLGEALIITEETRKHPLSVNEINNKIQHYLLGP